VRAPVAKEEALNSPLEYILVGIVTLGVLIYLVLALLMPEKF
jgi:K+-transporting ATPase KdpF subunit